MHPIPNSSTTLIIRAMYNHVVLTQQLLDEHDEDVGLEVRMQLRINSLASFFFKVIILLLFLLDG